MFSKRALIIYLRVDIARFINNVEQKKHSS